MWHNYLDYVDLIVVNGLSKSIQCSLQYLLNNTKKGVGKGPLLECKMELQAPDIVFSPDLNQVCIFVTNASLVMHGLEPLFTMLSPPRTSKKLCQFRSAFLE